MNTKKTKMAKKALITEEPPTKQKHLLIYLILGLVAIFVFFIRLRLLGVPLERDEGEYAYMGQLLLQGILPYTEAYNMKFPGIYFVYALILAIFGQTHTGIHLALALVNITTSILLFLIGRRLFNNIVGIITASSFLIMTLSPAIQGFWANSEHFVILPAVGGILLMLWALEKHSIKGILFSGLLLGSTFLIKQHGIFFTLFGFIYFCLVYIRKRPSFSKKVFFDVGLFVLGIIMPFGLTIILFLTCGNFENFWFWTFKYASEYASSISISLGVANLKGSFVLIMKPNFLIMIVALFGLVSIFWSKAGKSRWFFVFGFFIASFFSICPGFYFRLHYYVLLIPAIALLFGVGVNSITERFSSFVTRVLVASCIATISLIYPLISQRVFLFKLSPEEACRVTYGLSPFPESLEIAKFIKKNTNENDKIAVLGSEPQIYFYSKRKAATGYIYMYALMELHQFAAQMQKEMISEIEASDPKYIVFTNIRTSWARRPDSEKHLMDWIQDYVPRNYELLGEVDLISPDSVVYKWGDEVKTYTPRSSRNIYIFRKKT